MICPFAGSIPIAETGSRAAAGGGALPEHGISEREQQNDADEYRLLHEDPLLGSREMLLYFISSTQQTASILINLGTGIGVDWDDKHDH